MNKSRKTKKVLIFDERRDLISVVSSIKGASELLGVTPRSVSDCCRGVSIMCKGHYYLRYLHPTIKLSGQNCFETHDLDLTRYDEMCGETRFYFSTRYDHTEGRKKMTTEEMRSLEKNLKNKALYQLNEYYAHNQKVVAQYGWFMEMNPDLYSPDIIEKKIDKEKTIELVIKGLMKHYETNLNEIIKEICKRHPERSDFIEEIMSGYKSGHIRLAILGIMSQVDGICNDKLKRIFFSKEKSANNKWIPKIANKLLEVKNDFYKVYITPILDDCPTFVHQSKIDMYPSKLNRHTAVHGEEINYGSKENFLKSISVFKYVSDILYFSDRCTEYEKSFERDIYPYLL